LAVTLAAYATGWLMAGGRTPFLLLAAHGAGPFKFRDEEDSSSGGYSKVAVPVLSSLINHLLLTMLLPLE
jgi:hypothetical protein